MDFVKIKQQPGKGKSIEVYPDFTTCRSKDLMIKGGKFYAVWDEENGLWSTDEYDIQRLVDKDLHEYANQIRERSENPVVIKDMASFKTRSWEEFKKYCKSISDNFKPLDSKITFANTQVQKSDYSSRRLGYSIDKGNTDAYDQIMNTLYDESEREKLEWAIGAIISGDSKKIQKFIVLYGDPGAGKGTILEIILKLFDGYCSSFDAKELTSASSGFATESFKDNPLVAVQTDGNLSKIEDNSKLNTIVSHEKLVINEKFKSKYEMKMNTFLFMATNEPVKITNSKSGLIRRLIDVKPSGRRLPYREYMRLMKQIDFELGAIAYHCLEVYSDRGEDYYAHYKPIDMMYQTDPMFNFVESQYFQYCEEDGTTLRQAYLAYKEYCKDIELSYAMPMYKFREELKAYFEKYYDRKDTLRSVYEGFKKEKFDRVGGHKSEEEPKEKFIFRKQKSIFDELAADYPAQLAKDDGTPAQMWSKVNTTLKDIQTSELHYVKVPENHIVIDFDLKDESGNKSFKRNLEAASKFPLTYAELSKSGEGIHLHYIYTGNPEELDRVYADDIEIKVFTGNSALRRKLTKCNDIPVAPISSGLPLRKEKKKMVDFETVKDEKYLIAVIKKALCKKVHSATRPNIDFIKMMLDQYYESGVHYDVSALKPAIIAFAADSTHQSEYCMKTVTKMKWHSKDIEEGPIKPAAEDEGEVGARKYKSDILVFYDVEVFPNLFLVNWKKAGKNNKVQRMINPTPNEIEALLDYKLVGFNCRRYDNHIMYARTMGYSNEQLYNLSQRIVKGDRNAFFGNAYNLSYTDVYDFCSTKQSLKKWEIELGIHHQELGFKWDEPVPVDKWEMVAEYCDNDVIATEAVFEARKADFIAREILAEIAGGSVNDTTNSLTTKIIFGNNRTPQDQFEYRNLAEPCKGKPSFPGYVFENGKSTYKGYEVGEGGWVYANPGMYGRVVTLDVASMHPSSVIAENLFGDEYTQKFKDILDARIAIKHKDFEKAKKMLGGVIAKYLDDESIAKNLAQALKIVINSVYGLTCAKFDNPFKDPRNKDNIVAKRGALFMINLKEEIEKRGFTVVHVKTDSIKIADPTDDILEFAKNYGKEYGYNFEIEHIFEKICLVNDAVYIAKLAKDDPEDPGQWTATGAQFAQPYVFKKLFSKEDISFDDLCETKSVSTELYLDFNETLENPDEHNLIFIGKVGRFCPIRPGCDGGVLLRDGKTAPPGTKGWRWKESEIVNDLGLQDQIDRDYYEQLVDKAKSDISKFGDFESFAA